MAVGCGGSDDASGSGGSSGSGTGGTGNSGGGNSGGGNTGGSGNSDGGNTGGSGNSGGGNTGGSGNSGPVETYGAAHDGGEFHLGPVDYAETQWHNACAPGGGYAPAVQAAEGNLLAGLWNGIPNVESYCDACIYVETAKGKSALLRVVTYGDTTPNSIDVSPEAYAILDSGEYPRLMTWKFAKCEDTGKLMYEFQTGSSEWWTSLWVRNGRVPITNVEVMSPNHSSFFALQRGSDGTLTDNGGFGNGSFTLRLTGMNGQSVTDDFAWPGGGIAGQTLTGKGNFQ
jgi:expansin (peptidoglycan-binding protein)